MYIIYIYIYAHMAFIDIVRYKSLLNPLKSRELAFAGFEFSI